MEGDKDPAGSVAKAFEEIVELRTDIASLSIQLHALSKELAHGIRGQKQQLHAPHHSQHHHTNSAHQNVIIPPALGGELRARESFQHPHQRIAQRRQSSITDTSPLAPPPPEDQHFDIDGPQPIIKSPNSERGVSTSATEIETLDLRSAAPSVLADDDTPRAGKPILVKSAPDVNINASWEIASARSDEHNGKDTVVGKADPDPASQPTTASSVTSADKSPITMSPRAATAKSAAIGTAAAEAARTAGIQPENPFVILMDIAYLFFAGITWIGAFFYSINGLDTPEAFLADTFIGLMVIAQVVSWFWIASRFFVQDRRGDWEVVETLVDIRQEYLKTWFRFDVILAFPFDWAFLGWAPRVFFFCQLRHALRFVRVAAISRGSNPLVGSRIWVGLVVPLIVVVCLVHSATSLVCTFFEIQYIDALYWAATTMSSTGYGDQRAAKSQTRQIFSICVIVLGVILVTAVTAVATSILSATDAVSAAIETKKALLASMMNHYHVPWPVQLEVIAAFPTALEHSNEEQFKTLIEDLPPFVVERLTTYIRAKVVSDAIPLFGECEVDVLLHVAQRLLHRYVQSNEAIVTAGDVGMEMYFLVRGVADVTIELPNGNTATVATLRAGSFFGEIALVTENCLRTASVYAVVLCELLVLSKADFEDLGFQFTAVRDIFAKVIEAASNRAKERDSKRK